MSKSTGIFGSSQPPTEVQAPGPDGAEEILRRVLQFIVLYNQNGELMLYVTFQRMREGVKRRFGRSGEKPHPSVRPSATKV